MGVATISTLLKTCRAVARGGNHFDLVEKVYGCGQGVTTISTLLKKCRAVAGVGNQFDPSKNGAGLLQWGANHFDPSKKSAGLDSHFLTLLKRARLWQWGAIIWTLLKKLRSVAGGGNNVCVYLVGRKGEKPKKNVQQRQNFQKLDLHNEIYTGVQESVSFASDL